MTHIDGEPHPIPPNSGAPYIIICSGRISVAATDDPIKKIDAASRCAAQLCSFLESRYRGLDTAKFKPVSDLQHFLMDNMSKLKKDGVNEKIAELFELFDELEDEVAY